MSIETLGQKHEKFFDDPEQVAAWLKLGPKVASIKEFLSKAAEFAAKLNEFSITDRDQSAPWARFSPYARVECVSEEPMVFTPDVDFRYQIKSYDTRTRENFTPEEAIIPAGMSVYFEHFRLRPVDAWQPEVVMEVTIFRDQKDASWQKGRVRQEHKPIIDIPYLVFDPALAGFTNIIDQKVRFESSFSATFRGLEEI